MGEAKRRFSRVHNLSQSCIFCGGLSKAENIDHVPAKILFDGKDRPRGLEFPACAICNNGSSKSDLVAAFLSRAYPGPTTETQRKDINKVLAALQRVAPELLVEMKIGRGAEKIAMRNLPADFKDGRLLRIGDKTREQMQIFCGKLGLGLHFDVTKMPLGTKGGIATKWYTNYQKFTGHFPKELESLLREAAPQTLSMGKKNLSNQFEYTWQISENQEFAMYFATFRASFAVVAFVAADIETLTSMPKDILTLEVLSPIELKRKIKNVSLMVVN